MYHCNFGPPLLEEGSRVVTGAAQVAPQEVHAAESIHNWNEYPAPSPGVSQDVYMIEPLGDDHGMASVMLHNAAGDRGASISFPISELPCLTVWKNPGGLNDGYVTGLEPSTSYPNLKTFERQRGRVVRLEPGATYRASLEIAVHVDKSAVAAMEERIRRLQGTKTPVLHSEFHRDFNPQAN
jgi:hypothetical protein